MRLQRPRHLADRLLLAGLRRRRRPETPSGVLLVSAGGLGDTVLFALVLPRFAALARDGEEVTVLLRRDAAKMAFVLPPEVRVETVDFRRFRRRAVYRWGVLRRLHGANYRLVVSTDYLRHPDLDEALIEACCASETVAMEPRPWPKHEAALLRNRAIYDRLFDSGPARRDKVLRWTAFADWLEGEKRPPPPVRLPGERLPPPVRLEGPTVFIQPFSAVPEKMSPPGLYRRIIEALPGDHRVVITGAPSDLERHPEYQSLLETPRVVFDGSTFEELLPALLAARLVVSVDTALMHLAVAAGVPTLCLASAAYAGEIVPYAPEITPGNVTFLYHHMDCAGCLGNCVHPPENASFPCVARLEEERVMEAVRSLL